MGFGTLWFQASTGGLGTYPLKIKGDYCRFLRALRVTYEVGTITTLLMRNQKTEVVRA